MNEGHSISERVFARTEMQQVLNLLSTANIDRTKAGARHLLSVPVVRDLSRDPRMIQIARRFVGASAKPFRATLFDKSPRANWLVVWHQDTALPLRERLERDGWGPWSTKAGVLYGHAPAWALERVVALRISLDDSTPTNGPLRVLPNSHQNGVLSDVEIQRLTQVTAAVDCDRRRR